MKRVAAYIIIFCLAAAVLYYKAELSLWKSNYDLLMQEHNSNRVMQWERLPKPITEYRLDTVFTFWGDEKNIVPGKQIFYK